MQCGDVSIIYHTAPLTVGVFIYSGNTIASPGTVIVAQSGFAPVPVAYIRLESDIIHKIININFFTYIVIIFIDFSTFFSTYS